MRHTNIMIEQLQRHFEQDVSRSTSVGRVNEECISRGNAFDLAAWFTWHTFDIVGDFTLGESFSCLETWTQDYTSGSCSRLARGGPKSSCCGI